MVTISLRLYTQGTMTYSFMSALVNACTRLCCRKCRLVQMRLPYADHATLLAIPQHVHIKLMTIALPAVIMSYKAYARCNWPVQACVWQAAERISSA